MEQNTMELPPTNKPGCNDNAAIVAALTDRYEKLSEMMAQATPPADIARFLYWPEIVVAGEGLGRVYRGLDDLMPMFVAVVSTELSSNCSWTVTDPFVTSESVAAAFTQVTSHFGGTKPDTNYCALYVWEKRGTDWKVIREQVCNGLMR